MHRYGINIEMEVKIYAASVAPSKGHNRVGVSLFT
jgi:hypothetical protein